MKLAIITVTNNGALLAGRLVQNLGGHIDVFARHGRNPLGVSHVYQSLSQLTARIFSQYDGLVFIMATGIVVRVIAPHIQDKRLDPAVVVMDEAGMHAISLLSGHIGGANDLAQVVGRAVGAEPVITTATDVIHKPAADVLAVKLDLVMEPFAQLKGINAAIANGEQVAFFIDFSLVNRHRYQQQAADLGVDLQDMAELADGNYDAAVIITDKTVPVGKTHLFLRPPTLAAGIGCRRGTASTDILYALRDACTRTGRSIGSVAVIGSSVVKQDEPGLMAIGRDLNIPLKFFTNAEIQQCITKYELDTSQFVEEQIGVGNVCEATALLAGQADKLIFPKTKYSQVTIAIAAAT